MFDKDLDPTGGWEGAYNGTFYMVFVGETYQLYNGEPPPDPRYPSNSPQSAFSMSKTDNNTVAGPPFEEVVPDGSGPLSIVSVQEPILVLQDGAGNQFDLNLTTATATPVQS